MDNQENNQPSEELLSAGLSPSQPAAPQPSPQPEQTFQPATVQSTPYQPVATQLLGSDKPKKVPLVLASIAFAMLSMAFLILGPGVLMLAMQLNPFSWIISFYYIYLVVGASIISFISTILYTIALIMAFKKTPKHLANIAIMMSGNIVGLAIMWLSGYKIIRISTILAAIIMLACVILPCLGLIILKQYRKRIIILQPGPSRSAKIFAVIALLGLIVESSIAVFYLSQLWQQYKPIIEANQQYQKGQEEQLNEAMDDKGISSQLGSMSFALCRNGFDIVHQISGDGEDAIIQCKSSDDIYELHSAYEKRNGYIIASAVYYGTTKNETLARYFPNQLYIYKNLRNSSYNEEVYLLLQADSIEEVVKKYAEPLYEYIKEQNATYHTNIDFEILYNEDLSSVTTTKDYIILAGGLHNIVNDWLPNGNGFNGPRGENYIFYGVDELKVLNDLAMNPGSYSEQTRSAVKFHPHLSFSITNGGQITLEELQAIMQSSQFCQDTNLGWQPCGQ